MSRIKKSIRSLLRTFYAILSLNVILFGYINCSPVHNISSSSFSSEGGDDGNPTNPPPPSNERTYFTCNAATLGNTKSQRLSKREFENTIKDLFASINASIIDNTTQGYIDELPNDLVRGKEETDLIYQSQVNLYEKIAFHLGTRIAGSTTYINAMPGTNGCLSNSTPNDACITNFITNFGLRVYRRPLTTAEVNLYKGYYNSSTYTTKTDKITAVISIFLQSPDFLYRIYDQGPSYSQIANTRVLTDYELASKMSYLINGTMPDQTLFDKAANGTLSNKENLRAEIQRLLQKPTARPNINRFFVEWLKYDQFENFANFPSSILNGINISGLSQSMTNDVANTIANVVFNQNGGFDDLMSTTTGYVNHEGLAAIYGVANTNGAVNLGASRAGIFSRAAFLARKPSSLTSPSRRGHFVLTDLLCEELGSPPPGAPVQVDPLQPGEFLTTRQRNHYLTIETRSGQPITACVGCHSRMNPFGYVYENFDPLGRLRPNAMEVVTNIVNGQSVSQSLPIDTNVETRELTGSNLSISGYIDLHHKLGQSSRALSCMTIKWFEFLQKRKAANEDNCYMNEVLTTIYGTDEDGQGSIKDMITDTILSDRFRYWKY